MLLLESFGLCVVSKWMSQGNIAQYLKDKENIDRIKLVSSPSLSWCIAPCSPGMLSCFGVASCRE